jgi:outer membrane protein TolC
MRARWCRGSWAVVALVAGCQTYEPKPLDAHASATAWLARSPGDETVRQFAARLVEAENRAAEVFDPSDGLTLMEAEPVALVFNRQLRVARLQANVTRATWDFAGLWEDPVAGVELERILSGVGNPWIAAATVGITIPISGRLDAAKAFAGAEYATKLDEVASMEWTTRARLRSLWMDWSLQKVRAELIDKLALDLEKIAELAQKQERAGSLSRIDAQVFVVEHASRQADAIAAAARVKELEFQIRDTLGLAPQAPVALVPLLIFAPRVAEEPSLQSAMAAGNLELQAVRSAYEAAEQSLQLEIREQYPDITVGPGYKYEDPGSRMLLGLSMPIPLWNRNQQGVAEAIAAREVARSAFDSTYEGLSAQLAIALTQFTAGRDVREALEAKVVPLADNQEQSVRRVASLGHVDPLLLLQAVNAQYSAKLRLADARASESIAAVQLDMLIGPASPQPALDANSDNPAPQTQGEQK